MNPEKYEPEHSVLKAEQTVDYELDSIEHELVSRYQPKFLARGGEHIVYKVPGHPELVVKASTRSLKKIIEWNLEHGQPVDSLPPKLEQHAREYLKQQTGRYQQLKKYFGADHVPSQKEFLVKIPITQNILTALYDGNPHAATHDVWSVVMVQKRVEALTNPHHLAMVSGYTERNEISEDLYHQGIEHLIFGKNLKEKMDKKTFLEIQSHNDLKTLLEKSEQDESLRTCLKELVEKIISYTQETEEIFDLAGQDNIVFSKKGETWTYTLVDTLYPGEKMIGKTKIILLKLSMGNEIDNYEKNVLLNVFNFVRTVNGLAEQIGIQKRITIVPEGMPQLPIDFLKLIQ